MKTETEIQNREYGMLFLNAGEYKLFLKTLFYQRIVGKGICLQ